MDTIDQSLLAIIQDDFPICSRPYAKLAQELGITEEEAIDRLTKLKELGIVRRLGGVFDSRRLGYHSTLCAMEVPQNQLDKVVEMVNSYLGVTHNYIRNHEYNLWFTLITPSLETSQKTLEEIEAKTNLKVYNLPAQRVFKIKVNFQVPKKGGV